MKVKELMIGDYVEYNHRPFLIKELSIFDDNDIYGHISIMGNRDNLREKIQPIPLTERIRERISDNPNMAIYWDDRRTEETGENWYELRVHNGPDIALTFQLRYVHELQHALHLCDIDMSIEQIDL